MNVLTSKEYQTETDSLINEPAIIKMYETLREGIEQGFKPNFDDFTLMQQANAEYFRQTGKAGKFIGSVIFALKRLYDNDSTIAK